MNVNYYIRNTKDLLALKSFENPIGGINNYWTNDGELRNTGFEFGLNGKPVALPPHRGRLDGGLLLRHA